MKILYSLLFLLPFSLAFACKQTFSLQTQGKLSSLEILEEIAKDCQLNLIFLDAFAKDILLQDKPELYVYKLKLEDFLNLLFEQSNIHHTLEGKILKISFLYTQTYELNYVSTSRVGSSSTDVVLSPNPSSQEIYRSPLNDEANLSKRALEMGTAQGISDSGRSGTKIFSIDENNFWGEIKKELLQIAYRPEDKMKDKMLEQVPKSITINKNAGLLTITATKNQHQRIQNYLERLNSKMHSQVLVDVHILITKHKNAKTAGINWNEFYNLGNLSISPPNGGNSLFQIGNSGVNIELNILSQGTTFNRIIEFLESYGETRSLSNPKVLTLNNQPAIISVGSVLRYTQNSIFQSASQGSSIQNSIETYPSIFSGVLLDITPSIQGDEIILKINPSITRTKNTALESEPNALKSPPNLSTNQLSSLVKVKSGERIVLGGLISEIESKKEFKIPILGDIPLLGYLFKYQWSNLLSEEMVIIISPTIMTMPKSVHLADSFSQDFKSLLKRTRFQALEEKELKAKNSKIKAPKNPNKIKP